LKVQPYAGDPQALLSSKRWHLQQPDGLLRITQSREHGGLVVATAQEIDDRAAAEALKGARVFVARSSFPTAGADEYYWVDLIGCTVVNREGVELGTVDDLIDTGTHSVLRVVQGDHECLVPFVAAYVDGVDLAARRITADWQADY
jgi:16S rRNA processing protein RimM